MNDKFEIPDNYEVYCFDIFDTIISRTVCPEHVKKIWSKEIKQVLGLKESSSLIYQLRNGLEAELCKKNETLGYDLEFQYETLMISMYKQLATNTSLEEFCQKAYEIELEIESRVQFTCTDTVEYIKELNKKGKKLYCISDFYMPKKFLLELFKYHGIESLFDDVFVSSEVLLTKRSGRLYKYVIEQLQLMPESAVMVGDNQWSDVESAESCNFNAIHIDRTEQHNKYKIFEEEQKKFSALETVTKLYNKCNRNNYEDLTFSLYSFIEKLYYDLRRNSIKNVFFLSREGEFLKKIFDYYQGTRIKDENRKIQTHYLMVSRKATLMASLKSLDQESFEMIFRQYINISLYDFLSSLGYSPEEQEELGRQLNFDIREKVTDLPRSQIYMKLLENDYFRELYEEKRISQKTNFAKYLDSFGVDLEKEFLCLVDVGWKGTIQDNIFIYFGEQKKILGLYLGLVAPGKEADQNIKKGLLFDVVNNGKSKYFDIYNENKSIYEVVLGASHGSADRYICENGVITVATAQQTEEKELYETLIKPIQDGIYNLFINVDHELRDSFYDVQDLEALWADIHAHLVFLPTKQQIDIFYKIYHFENFGVFEFTKFKTTDHISVSMRIKNFKRMIKERCKFFSESFWGVIALRDAGLSAFIKPYGWYMYNKFLKKNRGE